MIGKTEYKNFATIFFRATSILLIFIGLSFAAVTIFWDTFLGNSSAEYNETLGRLNAVFGLLSAAFSFSGLIIGLASSYFSEKICKNL